MVSRDGYSRVSLVLQSFPTPITFARIVTRDISKHFYYSDRSTPVSRVIWRDILERGVLEYVSPLLRATKSWRRCYNEILRQRRGVCSQENDFVWRFRASKRTPFVPSAFSTRECIVIVENARPNVQQCVLYRRECSTQSFSKYFHVTACVCVMDSNFQFLIDPRRQAGISET